ncbi:pyrimidine-nucleoside phosphorylase [bacterium BMS3Abin04]|nr:pyrimidine-nucleoside phosphorylase [bacterium BMS3Abin04]
MNTIELITKKRNGNSLTKGEIEYLVMNYTKHKIPDYQFSAFLMAAFLNGLNKNETSALTKSMLHSGKILDLSAIPGYKIDKHSTGGVGDKTSLIIAPIVAAAEVNVPMISGRGLGHTGGTLDKLEAIPGFKTSLNLTQYKNTLKKCGAVLIGQTKDIAPADKLIYALRDVTATVESIPFITASIMSKKLAEGIDGLVLDVKTGSGAFMKKQKDAEELAASLINTAKSFKKKVIALITDMNQPLGNYIGNWFEVYESIQILQGKYVEGLSEISMNLSGAMLFLGNKVNSIEEGIELSNEMIKSGKAFKKFVEIVKLQGGNEFYILNPEKYPSTKYSEKIISSKTGYLQKVDTFNIGVASLELGAGRRTKEDIIDPKAGIIFYPKIGNRIKKGSVVAELYSDDKIKIETAKKLVEDSVTLSTKKTSKTKLIKKILK